MAGIDTPLSLLDRLLRHDDAAAWEQFAELYEPLIRRWVARLVTQPADVDNVVQEVLTALLEGLPKFRHNFHRGAFRTWLRSITIHRVRRHWRTRGPAAGPIPELENLEDPRSDLSRIWDDEHDRHVLHSLLEKIRPEFDDRDWRIFESLVLGGLPARRIADEEGCSPNAVYIVKSRVLKRLRLEARGLIG